MNPLRAAVLLAWALAVPSADAQVPDLYDESVLRTLHLSFAQPDWETQLVANHGTDTYISADLTVDGLLYPNVGVRLRGTGSFNWTQFVGSQKWPVKIKMNEFVPGQRLLGYKTVNLGNGYRDPTFMREVLTFRLLREFMPAPKANHVLLTINGVNWGVYSNIQQLNKDFMDEWFKDNDGNRYEADRQTPSAPTNSSSLNYLGALPTDYQQNYELKNSVTLNPWLDLIDVCDKLNNTPLPTLESTLEQVFATDRALFMLAANNVYTNPDSYVGHGDNYFIVSDDHHQRMNMIPWGVNASFGSSPQAGLDPATRPYFDIFTNETNPARPLMERLFQLHEPRQTYLAHIRTVLDEVFDWSIIHPIIIEKQALIDAAVQADTKKLYTYAGFSSNVHTTYWWGDDEYFTGIEEIVSNRRPFLLAHPEVSLPAPTIDAVFRTPAIPSSTESVTVIASVTGAVAPVGDVFLFHRTVGAFQRVQMFDDGASGDGAAGDGVYGATIPAAGSAALVEYYVRAASDMSSGGAMTFNPRRSELAPYSYQVQAAVAPGAVVINEFVAKNNFGITDELGSPEDWLELMNVSGAPIDIGGRYLTDDLLVPTKWQIPSPTLLQPGEAIVIWADNAPLEGPLHAAFKLGAAGEEIGFFDIDGTTLLDAFVFGPQIADVSTGRLEDAGSPWVTYASPTPGASNELPGCGVRPFGPQYAPAHGIDLSFATTPAIGTISLLQGMGGPTSGIHILVFSAGADYVPFQITPEVALVDTTQLLTTLTLPSPPTGNLNLHLWVPAQPLLVGLRAYLQLFTADVLGVVDASNALEVIFCP